MRILFLICAVMLVATPLLGDWKVEEKRIEHLLVKIGRVDGVFVRNGEAHEPAAAVDHLRMKLERAMNSWFAPSKNKWTAEMFIDRLASSSSMSGKPYLIRFRNGPEVEAGPWLHEQLIKLTGNSQ